MSKRTLDSFFTPPTKKSKQTVEILNGDKSSSKENDKRSHETVKPITDDYTYTTAHITYPWAIADLPNDLCASLEDLLGNAEGFPFTNQPHLDLLYFQPLIPQSTANELFKFLRANLPFYRVCYSINRFGKTLDINTPRFTTVFGLDETSRFSTTATPNEGCHRETKLSTSMVETKNLNREVVSSKYKCTPRPIPPCLSVLKNLTEALTDDTYNFVLVNYYASGTDSISYHSDDERFLGPNPAIASYTLGARRDFLMKHKPPEQNQSAVEAEPLKFNLGPGDMLLMRGETQAHWLHSIPKRKGADADKGRINITMRKAMVPGGTENYYRYNVGDGPVYKWDDVKREMVLWKTR